MSTTPETQKKNRFSSIFKKKDKNQTLPTEPEPEPTRRNNTTQQNIDSAYASSEPPSTTSEPNIIPVENRGQIENVSADRHLQLNKTTGDVTDRDTGEVVSTITTTTTTTTITTAKRGRDGNITLNVTAKPSDHAASNATNSVVSNDSAPPPHTSTMFEAPGDSAVPRYENTQAMYGGHMQQPVIPPRSPHRRSRDLTETLNHPSMPNTSSTGYNFSHPSRGGTRPGEDTYTMVSDPMSAPSNRSTVESLRTLAKQQTSADTYQSLKLAAKGLHGVGETLRGAINAEIDHRIPPRDAQKSQAVHLKNQSVIDRGREEMARLEEHRGRYNTARAQPESLVSPVQPEQAQAWPSRSPSRSSGGKGGIRKLIKRKSVVK